MSSQFGVRILVEYAGSQWRVQRALGVGAVLLRSDAGEEVAADPLKLQRPVAAIPTLSPDPPIDELRYSEVVSVNIG